MPTSAWPIDSYRTYSIACVGTYNLFSSPPGKAESEKATGAIASNWFYAQFNGLHCNSFVYNDVGPSSSHYDDHDLLSSSWGLMCVVQHHKIRGERVRVDRRRREDLIAIAVGSLWSEEVFALWYRSSPSRKLPSVNYESNTISKVAVKWAR